MNLISLPAIQYVDERDIDFILLEEFHSEPLFVDWFIRKLIPGDPQVKFVNAWHSVSDPALGESDLILVADVGGERLGMLIENKIDAPAQPNQAARYASRGQCGLLEGDWVRRATCIVAPLKYLQGDIEAAHYNHCISYEDVRDWLRDNTADTKRRAFRLLVLETAIRQSRRGRPKQHDERVSRFFPDYYAFAQRHFPDTCPKENRNPGANNTWPEFRPDGLTDRHRYAYIFHKTDMGCVDLSLEGRVGDVSTIRQLNQALLDSELRLCSKGKSAVFTIRVPPVNTKMLVAEQELQARAALQAVQRLASVARSLQLPG